MIKMYAFRLLVRIENSDSLKTNHLFDYNPVALDNLHGHAPLIYLNFLAVCFFHRLEHYFRNTFRT